MPIDSRLQSKLLVEPSIFCSLSIFSVLYLPPVADVRGVDGPIQCEDLEACVSRKYLHLTLRVLTTFTSAIDRDFNQRG